MNTGKIVFVVLLVAFALIAVFTMQGQSPSALQSSLAVQVPAAINIAIEVGLIALMTAGATWLLTATGLDLRGHAQTLALAISAFVVGELQNIVNIVPARYDLYLNIFFHALTLILAPVGALWLLKRRGGPVAETSETSQGFM